jgi:hypothetical protein
MTATPTSYLPFGVFFLPHIEKTLHYRGGKSLFILFLLKTLKAHIKKSQALPPGFCSISFSMLITFSGQLLNSEILKPVFFRVEVPFDDALYASPVTVLAHLVEHVSH